MQTKVIDENKLINFLNDVNTSDTFTILDSFVNGNVQPVHLVKEYDPSQTFAMVYDTYKPECLEITDVPFGKAWIYVGIYFKDLGAFVYKERYVNLVTEHCTEIKTILEDDLYNDLFEHSNRELGSRKSQLAEAYKVDEALIEENIKMNKDKMFKELVTGITEDTFEIQKSNFNIYRSSQLTHQYLKDKEQCVVEFINRYIEENEKEIKCMALYPLALNVYECKLETNEYFKKVKRAYILLNRKFAKAVNVWVVTKGGERIKVFNEFSINGEEAVIGINANVIHLKDVVQIEYKGYNVTI